MARLDLLTLNDGNGVDHFIPDIILSEVQATAAREEVFMPLARRIDCTGPGDTYKVPQAGALSFGSLTVSSTAPAEDRFTSEARTLTPALRYCDVIVSVDAMQSAQASVMDAIVREAGIALAADRDAGFAALYTEAPSSGPDHEIGTDGTSLSFASLRSGLDLLYIQQAPRRFAWVVYPTQWAGELLLDDTLINASVKGQPVLTQGMQAGGYVTSVLDCDIHVSDQILESSGRHSMMFSKNAALGYGFKRLTHPVTGNAQELMIDIDWNSAYRFIEINMTYWADFEGLKGSSTTTNNWLVDIIS